MFDNYDTDGIHKWELLHSATSQIQGDNWRHKLNNLGCVNVLPCHAHSTPQGTVVDEYGAVTKRLLTEENQRNSKKKETAPIQIRSVRISHKVTRDWTRGSAVRGQSLAAWAVVQLYEVTRPETTDGNRSLSCVINSAFCPGFSLSPHRKFSMYAADAFLKPRKLKNQLPIKCM
jgi:hypothetical protein